MTTSEFEQRVRQMQRPRLVNPTIGLVASGIGKSFRGKRVVRNVSLRLQRGEAVGLLGPNGAGKTTTLEMIEGLNDIDGGEDDDYTHIGT